MPSKTISAPTSPTKSTSLLQRVQSLTGVAKEVTSNITSNILGTDKVQQGLKIPQRVEGVLNVLIIDDEATDWSKYFKQKQIQQCTLQIHQTEFSNLSIVSGSDFGCLATYTTYKDSSKSQLTFQPDFCLIRQNLKDAGRDYKNQLIALMYGNVPSINSLQAVYNFQDKPWVFAHMMQRGRGLPLIEQYFYPDYCNMNKVVGKLPAVLKIGHAHGGLGKIRVGNFNDFQDASSVVAVTGTYCTSEPYVESRCDVHVQKIGDQYKAFMRKGIVGHWKSGTGIAMLEQVPMNERYKQWVDGVATLFGGLDICALEVIVGKDNREYIIEVNDSALTLMGETQEEDRRHIAELCLSRMALYCKPPQARRASQEMERRDSQSSGPGGRRDSQGSRPAFFQRQNSQGPAPQPGDDGEDTMKNLRKTFAGIFGDM